MIAGQQEFGSNKLAEKEQDIEEDIHAFNHHMDLLSSAGFAQQFLYCQSKSHF